MNAKRLVLLMNIKKRNLVVTAFANAQVRSVTGL